MKPTLLSTKIFLACGLVLAAFCLASFGILYHAQTNQAVQEMDLRLDNEALSLSVLVSAKANGQFDFEISPFFQSQYGSLRPSGFFRFVGLKGANVFRESKGAPPISGCSADRPSASTITLSDLRVFRVKSLIIHPEFDEEADKPSQTAPGGLCVIVGVDEAPYRNLVSATLFSTLPILAALALLLAGVLLLLVRGLTRDLSNLTGALATANFAATHEFPPLPEPSTQEVKAVVEKLASLHRQAADVYREMWLFLGRAAHQLKTPVTALQATLQVLLRKERSREELLSGLTDAASAVELLSALTKKLITSSRISYEQLPEKKPVDMVTFFSEQLKLFQAQAKARGISLMVQTSGETVILADSFLLSELFGNLVENALLYSPQGQGATVAISWTQSNREALVEISDQGGGFSAHVRKTLFQPFARGDERQAGGSGLGLSIAKKAAQLLGGDLTLHETGAAGSVILVKLPLANVDGTI
jgi:two-component system phosphate regulon sensor histidine kinase PhoR